MNSVRSGLFGLEILVPDPQGETTDEEGNTYKALTAVEVNREGATYHIVVAPPLGSTFALRAILPYHDRFECVFSMNGMDLLTGLPLTCETRGQIMHQSLDVLHASNATLDRAPRPFMVDSTFNGYGMARREHAVPVISLTVFREGCSDTLRSDEITACPSPAESWIRGEKAANFSVCFGTYGNLVRCGFLTNRPVRVGEGDEDSHLEDSYGWKGGRTRDKRQR